MYIIISFSIDFFLKIYKVFEVLHFLRYNKRNTKNILINYYFLCHVSKCLFPNFKSTQKPKNKK